MARISPVYGFITTMLPLNAWWLPPPAASSRSATNCRRSSIVKVMGVPGLASAAVLRVDAAPLHIGQQPLLPGRAAQVGFQRLFDAAVALLLEIDPAQDVRRQLARWDNGAGSRGRSRSSPICSSRKRCPSSKLIFALDHQVSAVVVVRQLQSFRTVPRGPCAAPSPESRRLRPDSGTLSGFTIYCFGGHAHRQRLPVAVEDGAARRGNLPHQFLVLSRHPRVFVVMQDLQRDQFQEYGRAPKEDNPAKPCKTSLHHSDLS